MTVKITRWSPDTCGCTIEYSWDDSVPESSRTHTLDNYVTKCADHSILATDTDRWNAVMEENPRKNITHALLLQAGPSTLYDIQPADGTRTLKGNITLNWTWSGTAPNRILTISLTGISLTTNQKNTIQSALNTRFGTGKVLIA